MKETDIKFADLPSAGIWADRDVDELLEELGRGWQVDELPSDSLAQPSPYLNVWGLGASSAGDEIPMVEPS